MNPIGLIKIIFGVKNYPVERNGVIKVFGGFASTTLPLMEIGKYFAAIDEKRWENFKFPFPATVT